MITAPYSRNRSFCLTALFLGIVSLGTAYGDIDRYAGSDWALLDAKATLAAAAEITLANYPNCDEATVDEKMVQVYRADGTGENQDEAFVKVLTEKGKRNHGTLALSFMLPYGNVQVTKIELIKPTGETVPVDIAANSKETIDNSQIAMNIYDPNSKILQVNIPGIEVGDVLHYVTHSNTLRPIIPGEFADENLLESDGYIRHLTYEVHAPVAKPLKKIALRDEISGTVVYTTRPGDDQTLVYRWDVSHVPRMFDEPSMPAREEVLQRVLVSTMADWHDVSKWYWNLSESHLTATSPELTQTVAALTAGAKSDADKAKALFYYVSQKVRYMGLTAEKDRPGFEPHDVCLTFGKKYGVCRDKAALLVSMLRTAGLKAYPVLVSVGSKKDVDVPDPGFNHAIVAAELTKGNYLLMDPTDEHARDFLPLHDGNQSYLVARPEGEVLQISPIKPPGQNLMRITTTGVLRKSGRLEAKSDIWFDGANDDVYRNAFSRMKADDVHRYFELCLRRAMPGARLTSLTVTPASMLDVSKELHAVMGFSVDGMTATGSGKAVVSLPWMGKELGLANMILGGASLEQRKYPLQTEVACGLHEVIALKLGEGFAGTESLPVYAPVDSDYLAYHQDVAARNGELDCSRDLQLKKVEFTASEYAELKRTLKDLDYDARKAPVLALAGGGVTSPDVASVDPAAATVDSDAVILNSEKTLEVTDPHSALYRVKYSKRILTYAGKIREAEIKVKFDPACESVRFVRGTVTSRTGQHQEIAPAEINVMDADWSASAKRYTGGKILVANLPGVDLGSTIDVEFEVAMKNKPFLAGFESFQLPDDLRHKTFELSAPAGTLIETKVSGDTALPATTEKAPDGRLVSRWTTAGMKALPAEQQLPPAWMCTSGVSYFVGDFSAYLKELNATMRARASSSVAAAAAARQIAATSASRLDAVRGIRDFVAKSVRLAGPSFTELPLDELSTADRTLADGYGHAADRAILLQAMLTAAGFQPDFVLASDLPALEKIRTTATAVPLPESFDTPLVRLTLDGKTFYLNDTDQYAQLGSTSHDDRLGLDLTTQACEVIAAAPDCQDRTETVYTLSLTDSGQLRMGILKHFYGGEYNTRNRYFSELRPEERKRYYEQLVSGVAQGARPAGDLTARFDTYPGTEQFTVDLDHYAVVDGKFFYFDLPFTPSLLDLPAADQRRLPLMLSSAEKNSIRTEIELPPGFQDLVIAPTSETLAAPAGGGSLHMTSSAEPGKFVLTDDFETSPVILSPHDYLDMQKIESVLEKKSAKVFLLERSSPGKVSTETPSLLPAAKS
jgi:transglutaminase-like putative cysteine protease